MGKVFMIVVFFLMLRYATRCLPIHESSNFQLGSVLRNNDEMLIKLKTSKNHTFLVKLHLSFSTLDEDEFENFVTDGDNSSSPANTSISYHRNTVSETSDEKKTVHIYTLNTSEEELSKPTNMNEVDGVESESLFLISFTL